MCQHSSIYLFGFFETRHDRVTLVSLGAIGFDGWIVVVGYEKSDILDNFFIVSSITPLISGQNRA